MMVTVVTLLGSSRARAPGMARRQAFAARRNAVVAAVLRVVMTRPSPCANSMAMRASASSLAVGDRICDAARRTIDLVIVLVSD